MTGGVVNLLRDTIPILPDRERREGADGFWPTATPFVGGPVARGRGTCCPSPISSLLCTTRSGQTISLRWHVVVLEVRRAERTLTHPLTRGALWLTDWR